MEAQRAVAVEAHWAAAAAMAVDETGRATEAEGRVGTSQSSLCTP